MDDRELAERLTQIEAKLNLILEDRGFKHNDEDGYYKPEAKKGDS